MAAPVPPPPWINFKALWEILVFGLVAGAGLPALFAIGLRTLSLSGGARAKTAAAGGADSDSVIGGSVVGMVVGGLCFLIVLAAVAWAIYAIYQSGHPAPAPK
jgi:hypothetical protein